MHNHFAEVERDPTLTGGPGVFRLYRGSKLLGEWDCITGGAQLDAKKYGGLCPPLGWIMTQPITNNDHPIRGFLNMSIIVPSSGGKKDFPKRSLYGQDGYPFMIHIKGSSTGCIAIDPKQYSEFVKKINEAFESDSFTIEVFDTKTQWIVCEICEARFEMIEEDQNCPLCCGL